MNKGWAIIKRILYARMEASVLLRGRIDGLWVTEVYHKRSKAFCVKFWVLCCVFKSLCVYIKKFNRLFWICVL